MSVTEAPSSKKETIQGFFDSIAPSYDGINKVLSLNLDESWRKKSRDLIYSPEQKTILDLGVGTGKFISLFLEKKKWETAVGLDFSIGMLRCGKESLKNAIQWVSGDFHHLPFQNDSFDAVISSYTLRSVQEMPKFFGELRRVLRANGKAGLLCLTRPRNWFWRMMSYPYLKFFLPFVGGTLSGNRKAYEFLSSSILTFQEPQKTADMLKQQGFQEVQIISFSFGLATLIIARK